MVYRQRAQESGRSGAKTFAAVVSGCAVVAAWARNLTTKTRSTRSQHEVEKRGCVLFVKIFVCLVSSWLNFFGAADEMVVSGRNAFAVPPGAS
jgi:hypothetical protein